MFKIFLITAPARGDRDSGSGGEFILSRDSSKYAQYSKDCPNSIVSTGILTVDSGKPVSHSFYRLTMR